MSLVGSQTGRKTGKMIQVCLVKSGQMRISGIGGCSHSGTKVRDPGRSTNIQIYVGGFNGERAFLTCWQGFDMVGWSPTTGGWNPTTGGWSPTTGERTPLRDYNRREGRRNEEIGKL